MPSPIVRETIRKLTERRALLLKQVKGPLKEIQQIEEDLVALGASPRKPSAKRPPRAPRRPAGANQTAILRAVRNGATEPADIAAKTGLTPASVNASVTNYLNTSKLLTRGPNGLTLTKAGREKLAALESAAGV